MKRFSAPTFIAPPFQCIVELGWFSLSRLHFPSVSVQFPSSIFSFQPLSLLFYLPVFPHNRYLFAFFSPFFSFVFSSIVFVDICLWIFSHNWRIVCGLASMLCPVGLFDLRLGSELVGEIWNHIDRIAFLVCHHSNIDEDRSKIYTKKT